MEGYGDRLARGASSATFGPNGNITDERWRAAFEGFDPEDFKKNGFKSEDGASAGKKERTRP
jgi:hypothetical protein